MTPEQLEEMQARIHHVLSKQVFFIAGAPKSGTTWLQRLLDAHPEVVCSGEGHFADKISSPLNRVVEAYNKHQDLVKERVYENKPYYSGLSRDDFEYAALSLACLVMAQRPIAEGIKCVGDKTPRYTFFLGHLGKLFPQARFIHIIRDGRDMVVSLCHHALRAGDEHALDVGSETFLKHVENFSKSWAENVTAARRFGKHNPGRYHEVRYEDLYGEPESTMSGLLEFLGVDAGAEAARGCIEAADFKKLSGGRDKGEENKHSFFRKGVAGDWKNYFDDASLERFRGQTGSLLSDLGYE